MTGVSSGVIDTPWWDAVPEEQKQEMFKEFAAKTPVGRVGQPEDVTKGIVFLIGDDFITSQSDPGYACAHTTSLNMHIRVLSNGF